MFIGDFVGETPWIHLDIAGTAWLDDAKPYMAKGASGVGVRTFVKLAESWCTRWGGRPRRAGPLGPAVHLARNGG